MRVLLEEVFAVDAFRAAHDRQRTPCQARPRVISDLFPVANQIALADPRPQRPIGMRQRDTCKGLRPGPGGSGGDKAAFPASRWPAVLIAGRPAWRASFRRQGDNGGERPAPSGAASKHNPAALLLWVRNRPDDLPRRLILSQAEEHGMTQPSGA